MLEQRETTQIDYAFTAIDEAVRNFDQKASLGLTRGQLLTQLHTAREEALAVDVNSISDPSVLTQFIEKQQNLLSKIQQLNSEKE